MTEPGFEGLDHTVQLTHIWINDVHERLGWGSKHQAYRLLRTVLQALRDRLSVNEAAHFGAQLPILLRGVYYENWRPAAARVKERGKKSFLQRIQKDLAPDSIANLEEAVTSVFEIISARITAGEVADIRQSLPANLRALWPLGK